MAQLLIRKRKHFAEDTKPASWSDVKWAGRPLRGDVVEVRENGYWRIEALGTGTHGWDRNAFALIQITNLQLAQLEKYQGHYREGADDAPPTKLFKARFRIQNWDTDIPWNKNVVTVGNPPVTVEEWYYIRSNLHGIVTPTDKAAT